MMKIVNMNFINKVKVFLKWIRYRELILLTSPGLMGLALGRYSLFDAIKDGKINDIIIFLISLCLGGAHVFLFNLWAGIKLNPIDTLSIDYPLKEEEINANAIFTVSIILLIISLMFNLYLNKKLFIASITIATLWILYAYPKGLFLKSSYTGALIVHYINGNLHFLIGLLLFNNLTLESILIAHFFSFIFLAGYFHHILKDRESDKQMKIKTLANVFDPKKIFIIGNTIFLISYLYNGFLVIVSSFPLIFFIFNSFIIILLSFYFVKVIRSDLSKEIIIRYRTYYRFLYSILGVLMTFIIYYK